MGSRLPEAARERRAEEARQLYAWLLVEHERVRHALEARAATAWRPASECARTDRTDYRPTGDRFSRKSCVEPSRPKCLIAITLQLIPSP